MKILNWNTQADKLRPGTVKFERVRQLIAGHDADIICLTEAFPELTPEGGHKETSDLSDWAPEARGARKVVLWSRFGWTNIDKTGSANLPEGRFVCATTTFGGKHLNFVGMCIPYHNYRVRKTWGGKRKNPWEGACEYLDALREDILTRASFQRRSILLGDFNLQVPPKGYPGINSAVNQRREVTFSGWTMPTTGVRNAPELDKPFIDHIACSPDIRVQAPQFFSRFDTDSAELSDHNGVCIEIQLS